MEKVKIPESASDITTDWVKLVTGDEVLPEDFFVQGNFQEGKGFFSTMYRVSYKAPSNSQLSKPEQKAIIVKLLPTDSEWLEFALIDLSDEREIHFYSKVFPDIVEVLPEFAENICKYYGGTVQQADPSKGRAKASMLVMEDLGMKGFQMMDFSGARSDKAVEDVVTFLARLHYGAFAVAEKKGKSLPELYPFMQSITEDHAWLDQIEKLSDGGYNDWKELVERFQISEEVWKKYEKLKPYTLKIVKEIDASGRKNPCLIHGDCWPPNILEHETLPVKILDWQLVGYRDVTYDLGIMLFTVLPKDKLTKDNLLRLLRKYYDEFERLCKASSMENKIRNWDEFKEFFFTWGVSFTFLIILPSVFCYQKDLEKYVNVFKVLCEDYNVPDFLLKVCTDGE